MRTFVAVEISNRKVIENISKIQSNMDIKAKKIDPHNLHFTLQFLGEVSEELSGKVGEKLSSIEFSKFSVKFQGIGVFPKPKFPRIIWVGTDAAGGENLAYLAKKVEHVLDPLGIKSDKPFKPHVTIFRIKNKIGDISEELKKFERLDFGEQQVNQIKFKMSVLERTGPIYSDLRVIESK